jgi:hypothetical protein
MEDDPLKNFEEYDESNSESTDQPKMDLGAMLQSFGVDGQAIDTAKTTWQQVSPVVDKLGPDRLLFGAGVLLIAGSAFYGMRNRKD